MSIGNMLATCPGIQNVHGSCSWRHAPKIPCYRKKSTGVKSQKSLCTLEFAVISTQLAGHTGSYIFFGFAAITWNPANAFGLFGTEAGPKPGFANNAFQGGDKKIDCFENSKSFPRGGTKDYYLALLYQDDSGPKMSASKNRADAKRPVVDPNLVRVASGKAQSFNRNRGQLEVLWMGFLTAASALLLFIHFLYLYQLLPVLPSMEKATDVSSSHDGLPLICQAFILVNGLSVMVLASTGTVCTAVTRGFDALSNLRSALFRRSQIWSNGLGGCPVLIWTTLYVFPYQCVYTMGGSRVCARVCVCNKPIFHWPTK